MIFLYIYNRNLIIWILTSLFDVAKRSTTIEKVTTALKRKGEICWSSLRTSCCSRLRSRGILWLLNFYEITHAVSWSLLNQPYQPGCVLPTLFGNTDAMMNEMCKRFSITEKVQFTLKNRKLFISQELCKNV